jgi:uncharacterized protein YndB with AHSA1/START domain
MFRRPRSVQRKLRLDAPVERVWELLTHPDALYWQVDNCVLTLCAPPDLLPELGELRVYVREWRDGSYAAGVDETEVVEHLRHLRRVERNRPNGTTFDFILQSDHRGTQVRLSASNTMSSFDWAHVVRGHEGHLKRMALRLTDSLEVGPTPQAAAADYLIPDAESLNCEISQAVDIAASAARVMALVDRPDDPSGLTPNTHLWLTSSDGVDLVGGIQTSEDGLLLGGIMQRVRTGPESVILRHVKAEDRYELSHSPSGVTLRLTKRRELLPGTEPPALADAEGELREQSAQWLAWIKAFAEAGA